VFGGKFIPHDRRQDVCCTQCGINLSNDEASLERETTYAEAKIIREVDNRLKILYMKYFDGKFCLLHIDHFRLHEIDLRYFVIRKKNPATGLHILWLYKYGTELHSTNPDWIYIYKRP